LQINNDDQWLITTTFDALIECPVTAPWYSIRSPTLMTSFVVQSPQVRTCPDDNWAPFGINFSTVTVPEIVGYAWAKHPLKIYVDYPSNILIESTPWANAIAKALSAAYLAAWATNKLARAWFNWKFATPRAVLAAPLLPLWFATYLVASSRAFWAAVNATSAILRLAWASSLAWVARFTAFLAFLVFYFASINLLLA
jgi:hypothetical protein